MTPRVLPAATLRAVETDDPRLQVLVTLAPRLLAAADRDAAADELTGVLTKLGLSVAVDLIDKDVAVVLSVDVCGDSAPRVPEPVATSLVGMRLPVDGIDMLRIAVRHRRPYVGPAGAAATVRAVATDPHLAHAMPSRSDEGDSIAVPVLVGDDVVAVICAWVGGTDESLLPVFVTAAAIYAGTWPRRDGVASAPPTGSTTARRRGFRQSVEDLVAGPGIQAALQPIVRLHDRVVIGYEALCRFPRRPHLATPEQLFASAAGLHLETALDRRCIAAALEETPLTGTSDLFVNVLTGTLFDPTGIDELDRAVHAAGADPRAIVLEFSEREQVVELARLQRIAADLRARGYRIAVDDAGAGHASMRLIAELRPEFIKVDQALIRDIHSDRARRALVVALLSFSGHIGSRLIAEGIETQEDNDTLSSLGVQFGQGWLHGRPVLTSAMADHPDVEVVDVAWFAAHEVHSTRAPLRVAEPVAPVPAPRRAAGGRRSLALALSEVAHALQNEHDPLRILGVMGDLLTRVVPVDEMCIYVADYETHQFVPVIATGPDREQLMDSAFSLDAGITGWAFSTGSPQNIGDTSAHPLSRQVPGTSVIKESLLLVPLVAGEHKLGIIDCWRPGLERFSARDVEAAALFAHIAAAAWRNAQLYSDLLTAAMTDPLTGLHNSRWMHDSGAAELAEAAFEAKPMALLLLDLDHFKQVNDDAGHAAGDLALQRVAARLRAGVRTGDAVVRVGGEEFVAMLRDCDAAGALTVADGIRHAVAEISLPAGVRLDHLTASIGVAVYPEHGSTLEQLLAAADRAMYAAKHGGRDRVESAHVGDPTIVPLPRREHRTPHRRLEARSGQ